MDDFTTIESYRDRITRFEDEVPELLVDSKEKFLKAPKDET